MYILQATYPDVDVYAHEEAYNADSYTAQQVASDIDPYAAYTAYHAVYGNQVPSDRSSRSSVSEKQGFGSQAETTTSDNEAVR